MKNIYMFIGILVVTLVFAGCYGHVPKEKTAPPYIKEVALDTDAPSAGESDVIIMAHVKKGLTENPYTFTLIIDGNEFKKSIKGEKEKESSIAEERGEGVHYALIKRLRVKPGVHEITLKSEEDHSSTIELDLTGGKTYNIRFEPIYGPMRLGRPKHFKNGVLNFKALFDTENTLTK